VNRTTIYGIAAIVLATDQLTKWQALRSLSYDRPAVLVPGFLDLTLVSNTGGAFGILKDATWWLVIAALAAIVAIVTYTTRATLPITRTLGITMALPLGGALGNLLDRVRLHHVVDFVHAHVGSHEWPVFNVADSCICVGVGLLAVYVNAPPESEPDAVAGQTPEKETV
jgi:signal peptidase II